MQTRTKIAAVIIIAAATVFFETVDLSASPQYRLLDAQFALLRTWVPRPAAREVVIVGIDEETTRSIAEPITLWHSHLAKFFFAMAQARPAVVGVDIVLPDRSFDAVVPGIDKVLLAGLLEARRSHPVVLGLTVDFSGNRRPIHAPFLAVAGPAGAGYVLMPVDHDGHVRRFDERLGANRERVPTLAGQMARHLQVEPGAGLIDFWRGSPFDYIPFHQLAQWSDSGDHRALQQAFRDKPVLLGTVWRYEDRTRVPTKLAAWDSAALDVPGVVLHAQALRTILGNGLVRDVPHGVTLALTAASALLWLVSASTLAVLAVFIVMSAMLLAVSTWLLANGWFLPTAAPALGAALALAGRNVADTLQKLRERRRLRSSFSGYVSPAVMEEILAGRVQPDLGGENHFVCIMFSDIRGYTTRSEQMAPQQVIRFLNCYFEEVVTLIHARGGSVVSFMGDGIMAVFGAPKQLENPCQSAFDAARDMLEHVAGLNEQLEAKAAIEIGVGLHAGEAVIGHVGSSARHDYTAIGDATNVASRLEGLTKEAGYCIVLSRAVVEQLREPAELEFLGPTAIKGHTPVEVFGYKSIRARAGI
ncbi:MAG TPA: adenylate/guanylate cyclase domain-containing protein [Burkholderiales bacterium]|nr:adenylate/guanylate cyclase domain-containing protein [Burkholderiales bacterium]